jgi:glucose-1-phosphate thymidylyltransferase
MMKALILAGGKGTRLRPLTDTIPKQLLPVANKPILYYIMEQLQEAGLKDIGIIISPETGAILKAALGDGSRWNVNLEYIPQDKPLGLAHAVSTGANFLGESDFLLFLGDNLLKGGVKNLMSEYATHPADALIVLKEVVDPRAFGVAEVDGQGQVLRVVEKPKEPKSNLALVGAYVFKPAIHQAIARLKPSWRGEYEITDAIQGLLDDQKNVRSYVLKGWWLDTGKKEDLLEANRTLLSENTETKLAGTIKPDSRLSGKVEVGQGSTIEKSEINGPAIIGANCRILNADIGPFTSIEDNVNLENCAIENSIILQHATVRNIEKLQSSVIGRYVEVTGQTRTQTAVLFLGDYSRVELQSPRT